MLRRQFVRENADAVRAALEEKGVDVDLDQLLEIDAEWRSLKSEGDDLRHERNEVSSKIGQLKAEARMPKPRRLSNAPRSSKRSSRRSRPAPTSWKPNLRLDC